MALWTEARTFRDGDTVLKVRADISGPEIAAIWVVDAEGDQANSEAFRDELIQRFVGKPADDWPAEDDA